MIEPMEFAVSENGRGRFATYRLEHTTPGRSGTVLELRLQVTQGFGETSAQLTDCVAKVAGDDTEAALDKLAEWLERAAAEIRARGKPRAVLNSYGPPS